MVLACFSPSNFGEGNDSPSNDSYQWGSSSSELDSSDPANNDTAQSSEEIQIGYSNGNKAPNLYSTDQSGNPWILHEQNTFMLLLFGHMDTTALPLMIEQAISCNPDIPLGVLVGRSIYSSPATTKGKK